MTATVDKSLLGVDNDVCTPRSVPYVGAVGVATDGLVTAYDVLPGLPVAGVE